ncbi:hypothetical protein Dsin_011995 [Dipteronia sinensis]|uniref:Cytochrome P450 n=1 Tax=Dipteronia sinensis TaxID=43782 RepID=A0AAE0AI53_9ROSI|nr:hypothetical protein Dsin_011995 [Dipteronia sinensis]
MHYLQAAISESMRLYPPVPINTKACLDNDILPDGTFIGKGWFIIYHVYAMGRIEAIWSENCNKFVPERWLENGIYRQENQFRYPVFQAGPRICLGKDMAYIQMESIAASVIERFVMDVRDKNTCQKYVATMTKNERWVTCKGEGKMCGCDLLRFILKLIDQVVKMSQKHRGKKNKKRLKC